MDYKKTNYSENTFYKSENWKYFLQFKNFDNTRIIYQFEIEKINNDKINIKMDYYSIDFELFKNEWIKKDIHKQYVKDFTIKKLEYKFWNDIYAKLNWKKTFYFIDSIDLLLNKFENWNDLLNPLMDRIFLKNALEK